MRIEDDALLNRFRGPGCCELCGKWCKFREPHHAFSRGAGQLDIAINLVAVGSTRKMECRCHARAEGKDSPRITQETVLAVTAEREGVAVEGIVAEVYRLRALPQPRTGEPERPLEKRPKIRSAWQVKAGVLRRAYARAAYRRMKMTRQKRHGMGMAK